MSLPLWQELLAGGFIKGENALKILGVSIYCGETEIRTNVGDVLVFFIVVTECCESDADAFRDVTLLFVALEVISYCITSQSNS